MKKIVVFTGAGVSADSGLATFRDSDGLWANYRIEEVCTPEALAHDRAKVIGFYNMRRRELLEKQPNAGHYAIAELERDFAVEVVTQNVDNFHERAGSTHVTHLHGELMKLRSERNPDLIVPIEGWEQPLDAKAPDGALLRPHIVFFGAGARSRRADCRRHLACGLSRRLARALRAARGSGLSGRPGQSRHGVDSQSADPHPRAFGRRHATSGPRAARGGACPAGREVVARPSAAARRGGIIARPSAVRPAGVYARTQPDGMARQAGKPAETIRPRLGRGEQ